MGMFDNVVIEPGLFFCSEGHDLFEHGDSPTADMQTKDYECVMGDIVIDADRSVTQRTGVFGSNPMNARELEESEFTCYASCTACPAFVAMNGIGHVHAVWCEFRVVIRDGKASEIQYISKTTAEFLVETPLGTYYNGESWKALGPMPYADAQKISKRKWQEHCELRELEATTCHWLHDPGDETPGTQHFYCHAGFPPRNNEQVVMAYAESEAFGETE